MLKLYYMNTLLFLPSKPYSLLSSVVLWFFCGMGAFFAIILLWSAITDWPSDSSYKNLLLGVPLLLFFIWFRIQFFQQSAITVSAESITQRQPVISPQVAWNNIAKVSFRESTRMVNGAGAMVRVHRRIAEITTKNNKKINFVLSTFSQTDREQLEAWLEQAALSGTVPSEVVKTLKK